MAQTLQDLLLAVGGPVLPGLAGRIARNLTLPTPNAPPILPMTVQATLPAGGLLSGNVQVTLSRSSGPTSRLEVAADLQAATLVVPPPGGAQWDGQPTGGPAHLQANGVVTVVAHLDSTVTWTVRGAGTLRLDAPLTISGPGATGLRLEITSVSLGSDGAGPTVTAVGRAELQGIPGGSALGAAMVTLRWSSTGWTGDAAVTTAGVQWALAWVGNDIVPASLDVIAPLALHAPAAVPFPVLPATGPRLRVRGGRLPTGLDLSAAIEAGDGGLVVSTAREAAALVVLGTACAAGQPAAAGGGASLAALAAASAGLVNLPAFDASGKAMVTAVRLDLSSTDTVTVDYEGWLSVSIRAGLVEASTAAPMHVRVQRATFSLADLALDLRGASLDLADAGRWQVTSPGNLFQVAAVRSGHGSSWFELDLRFALDLGPVRVDGATLRVDLDTGAPSVRGFGISVDLAGFLTGSGSLSLSGNGFAAAAHVSIVPLHLDASAALAVDTTAGFASTVATADVGLPVPVPLANSGFGLMSIEGVIGIRRRPKNLGANLDQQLHWDPMRDTEPDQTGELFGAGLTVGTLPDLGTTLTATGKVVVAVPDLAVRVALEATILRAGPKLLGVLVVDKTGLFVGVEGAVTFPGSGFTLLEARIPVEAWFPAGKPNWHVYVGSDGQPGRESPGPMTFKVLPDLFGVTCEAFLMVSGDGLANVLGVLPDLPGFAVATGFRFATSYGVKPVLWADLHILAAIGVGTAPIVVAGTAKAGGGLHLGPFSLGVDVELDLQIGPGATRWAHLEACGSIDLFFFDVRGCVRLDLGQKVVPTPDPPAGSLKAARAGDPWGRRGTKAADLTTAPAGAPVIWPDATILLGFDPGPAPAPAPRVVSSTFTGLGYDAPEGVGGCKDQYEEHHTLTALDLVRDGGNLPAGSKLPARWQAVPGTSSTQGAARTLALLTRNPSLWATNLSDGGAGNPADPAKRARDDCQGLRRPGHGWALGGRASWLGPATHLLPPATPAASALDSQVVATATTRAPWLGNDVPVDPIWTLELPPANVPSPGVVEGGGPVDLPTGETVPGWLRLPRLGLVAKEPHVASTTTITLADPLISPVTPGDLPPTVVVLGPPGVSGALSVDPPAWSVAASPGPNGLELVVLTWNGVGTLSAIELHHPVQLGATGETVRLVAVGGCTGSAADAAAAANASGKAADAEVHAPLAVSPLLLPDTLHRVDVSWEAFAVRPATKGTTSATSSTPSGTEHRYFHTAPHASARPAESDLRAASNVFHPAMLVRYLRAYEPDGRIPWFLDDPMSVTFDSSTAPSLAVTYGYDLQLVLRRTDPPPGPVPSALFLVLEWVYASRFDLLSEFDRQGLTLVGDDCGWPTSAASGTAHTKLEPRASYDLTAVLVPQGAVAAADHREQTSLPASAFRTSRFASPTSMFSVLGFGGPALDLLHAVVPAGAIPPTPGEPADAEFLSAAVSAGLRLPPPTGPARTTVLWAGGAAPEPVGVLIEVDEPLVRSGRVGDLRLDHPSGPVRPILDRGTTAALFWAATPFPTGPITLHWGENQKDRSDPASPWKVARQADLAVPVPSTIDALTLEVTA
jgi:hypothetical protein